MKPHHLSLPSGLLGLALTVTSMSCTSTLNAQAEFDFMAAHDAWRAERPGLKRTSEEARDFQMEVSRRIYDPRNHGLYSMQFTLPVQVPAMDEGIELGSVQVRLGRGAFVRPQEPEPMPKVVCDHLSATDQEELRNDPEAYREMIRALEMGYGELCRRVLSGDLFEDVYKTHYGRLEKDDGGIRLVFHELPDVEPKQGTMTFTFNEHGLPATVVTANGRYRYRESFEWERVGDEFLLIAIHRPGHEQEFRYAPYRGMQLFTGVYEYHGNGAGFSMNTLRIRDISINDERVRLGR